MNHKERIKQLAQALIDTNDMFVVDVKEKGGKKYAIYVDARHGVTIGQCAKWNRTLRQSIVVEITELNEGNFELEVSSYGIGKSLIDTRQYAINEGRTVVAAFAGIDENEKQIKGTLVSTANNLMQISTTLKEGNTVLNIPFERVKDIYVEAVF